MPLAQLERVENNLRSLVRRAPELPLDATLILRAAIILGRDINALMLRQLRPAGLSETEFRLLMALFSHPEGASAGDLCAALAQSPANLTRIGDALVLRGYIRRDADLTDRRRMLLQLEPAGEQLLRALLPGICAEVGRIFDGFDDDRQQQLLGLLRALLGGIDAAHARRDHEQDVA